MNSNPYYSQSDREDEIEEDSLICLNLTLTWPPVWGPMGGPTSQEILLPSETLVDGCGCYFFCYKNIETGKKIYRTTWGPTGKPLS